MRRTPDGALVRDGRALQEWNAFITELESSLNVRVYGFDPRVSFVGLDDAGQEMYGSSVQIPVWLGQRILKLRANAANEPSSGSK